MPWAWTIPLAFLAGSIPFGLLIGLAKGVDVRTLGSRNIGATNVGRVLGRPYFFLCFALDFAKGLLPVLLAGKAAHLLGVPSIPPRDATLWLLAMAAPVLGHMFTPFLKFKGGKGVATSLGALLAVYPHLTLPALAAFAIFVVVALTSRYMSLGAIVASLCLPLLVLARLVLVARRAPADDPHGLIDALRLGSPFLVAAVVLGALVVWKHRANIARLRAGTENRLGGRTSPQSTAP